MLRTTGPDVPVVTQGWVMMGGFLALVEEAKGTRLFCTLIFGFAPPLNTTGMSKSDPDLTSPLFQLRLVYRQHKENYHFRGLNLFGTYLIRLLGPQLAPGTARYRFGIAQVLFRVSFSSQNNSTHEAHFDFDSQAETSQQCWVSQARFHHADWSDVFGLTYAGLGVAVELPAGIWRNRSARSPCKARARLSKAFAGGIQVTFHTSFLTQPCRNGAAG